MKPARQWFDFLALLAVAMCVVYLTVILPGRTKTEQLQAERDQVQSQVDEVKGEVDRLTREIEALERDPYYLEKRLRADARFLRPGERVFKSKPELPQPQRPTQSAANPR